ncbi:protein madd-4-like [Amphibalanus amphitrite]|uniref:protein madd-4-like n=1 Tax=Amphibalanus amphitrite TaxID=1232801 RepID=UPI001C8FB538|nr:protein madd-4-like [Amphibalanus amphitrite]XP_043198820.1 protein madd-4-like [Amphibalanus amphitrite]
MARHAAKVCILLAIATLPLATTATNSARRVDGWTEWSDWGPCSQPCDGGVTRQTRICHREHGCPGLGVRRQMCNMQVCVNATDPRVAQCAAYDHRRHSDGRRYRWEPYPDLTEPCALTCRAIGTGLVRQLSPRVIDGTRCRDGSLDICIDGKCEPLGCDLRIGSNRTVDVCGVCGGDGSSCSTAHHFWKEKEIAPCSATCGGGFQVMRPVCTSRTTGIEVSEQFCDFRLRPRDRLMECALTPCQASWTTDEWGQCSSSCDGGHKRRKVWCAEMVNGTLIQVSEARCSGNRPTSQEPCNFVACPKWYQGPWSQCSVTCGDSGQQTRAVFCRDARGHLSEACDPKLKPRGRQPCSSLMPCPLSQVKDSHSAHIPYQLPLSHAQPVFPAAVESSQQLTPSTDPKFVADTWGECSVTCGEGLRRRKVECKVYLEFSQTLVTLPPRECGSHPPADLERCILPPCLGLRSGDSYHQPFRQQHQQRSSDKTPRHTYDALYDVNDPPAFDHFSSSELPLGDTAVHSDPFSSPEHHGRPHLDRFSSPEIDSPRDDYRDGDDLFSSPEVNPFDDDFGSPEDVPGPDPPLRHHPDRFSSPERPIDSMVRLRTHMFNGGRTYQDVAGSFELLGGMRKGGRGGADDGRELDSGVVVIRPKEAQPPPEPPEQARFVWKKAGFTPCSSSCLGGVQESLVQCVRVSDGLEVSPFQCSLDTRPDSITRTCNDQPCPPRWNVTEFSACSRRCGKGTQTREVSCIHELARGEGNTLTVADSECAAPRPADNQLCNMVTCPPRWQPEPWSECSRSCGGGIKTRKLRCQQRMSDGSVVDKAPSMCGSKSPPHKRPCNTRKCRGPQIIASNQSYEQETPQRRVTLKIGGSAVVFDGTTVQLKCPVRHFDRSKIVWTKDGDRMTGGRKYRLKANGQVRVRHVEYHDAGRYTCIAGGVTASLNLSIRPSPFDEPQWVKERRLRRQKKKKLREERRRKKQRKLEQKLAEAAAAAPQYPTHRRTEMELSNTIEQVSEGGQHHSGPILPSGESPDSMNDVRVKFVSDQQASDSDQPKGLVLGSGRSRQRSRWSRKSTTTTSTTPGTTQSTTTTTAGASSSAAFDTVSDAPADTEGDGAATVREQDSTDGAVVAAPAPMAEGPEGTGGTGEATDSSHGLDEGVIEVLGKGDPSEVRFEWLITDWSPCSRTCGGSGYELRATQCLVKLNNTTRTVSAALCEDKGLPSPRSVRPCGQMPCPSWHVGEWRSCRRSRCVQWNYAMQRRKISCRLPNGTTVHPRLCDRRQRPDGRQECYNDRCRGVWRVEPWSKCSARCGSAGYQTRILRCVWSGTNKPAGNTCRDQPRPLVYKPCVGPTCPPLQESPRDPSGSIAHDERDDGSGCRDRKNFCSRARRLSLCSMQDIRSDCCRTCLDVG